MGLGRRRGHPPWFASPSGLVQRSVLGVQYRRSGWHLEIWPHRFRIRGHGGVDDDVLSATGGGPVSDGPFALRLVPVVFESRAGAFATSTGTALVVQRAVDDEPVFPAALLPGHQRGHLVATLIDIGWPYRVWPTHVSVWPMRQPPPPLVSPW